MNKGKQKYESQLVVEYDKTSLLTAADRKLHKDVTTKLFDMSESLAFHVYEINEMTTFANRLASENPGVKSIVDKMLPTLTELKESSVITTGDNYVGAAEPELREKLATLYSKIAASYTPPSKSELDNMSLLEETFNSITESLEKVKSGDWSELMKFVEKNGMETPKMMDKMEFLKG